MLIIDSNIWAYYFDEDASEHSSVTEHANTTLRTEKIALNTAIIMDVAHFLIRNLGSMLGKSRLQLFLSFPFTISDFDYDLTLRAIDILVKYSYTGLGRRDATILATAETFNINEIMIHDEVFKRVDWLK